LEDFNIVPFFVKQKNKEIKNQEFVCCRVFFFGYTYYYTCVFCCSICMFSVFSF
jgi:hypothetical protein